MLYLLTEDDEDDHVHFYACLRFNYMRMFKILHQKAMNNYSRLPHFDIKRRGEA